MKRILLVVALLSGGIGAAAADTLPAIPTTHGHQPVILNQVLVDLSAEQWIMTATAKVIIALDATIDKSQLAGFHSELMQKFKELAPQGDWHVTKFDRNEDGSGLEQLRIEAEVRLPDKQLANLQNQLKSVSKPGKTYRIVSIEFTPSSKEIEQARSKLRDKIYTDIQHELARLNKKFIGQTYFVNQISFVDNVRPLPMAKALIAGAHQAEMLSLAAANAPVTGNGLIISNKITQNARVILAAISASDSKALQARANKVMTDRK